MGWNSGYNNTLHPGMRAVALCGQRLWGGGREGETDNGCQFTTEFAQEVVVNQPCFLVSPIFVALWGRLG